MYHLAWVPTVAPITDFEERVTLFICFFSKKKKKKKKKKFSFIVFIQ